MTAKADEEPAHKRRFAHGFAIPRQSCRDSSATRLAGSAAREGEAKSSQEGTAPSLRAATVLYRLRTIRPIGGRSRALRNGWRHGV
jgi:hypothetical protein